jgi:hypothetical protein
MRTLNAMLLVVAATASTRADDYESMRAKLVVLDDGKHHYLAYARDPELLHTVWFYGDDTVLHRLTLNSSRPDVNRARATWQIHDLRYKSTASEILSDFDTSEFVVTCAKRKTALHSLAAPAAAKLIEHVKLADAVPRRLVTFLARGDADTTYYFVDRPWMPPGEPESSDYRLWIGKRGAMRRIPIRDLANDAAGLLLITDQGKLQYTQKTGALEWLPSGGKPRVLHPLVGGDNSDLIYNQLGVYANDRLGTPCDDL